MGGKTCRRRQEESNRSCFRHVAPVRIGNSRLKACGTYAEMAAHYGADRMCERFWTPPPQSVPATLVTFAIDANVSSILIDYFY